MENQKELTLEHGRKFVCRSRQRPIAGSDEDSQGPARDLSGQEGANHFVNSGSTEPNLLRPHTSFKHGAIQQPLIATAVPAPRATG